jgi:crescentin
MKIPRTTLMGQIVPEGASLFAKRLRGDPAPGTLLARFSQEGEENQPAGDDVLGAVGQQDERMRDRIIQMVERLEDVRTLRDEFAILVEPLLALAREHPQLQSRLVEAEASLRHERAAHEIVSRQVNDLTHQNLSLSDEIALALTQTGKQDRVIEEQERLLESLRRARQEAEALAESLKAQLAAEAERTKAALAAGAERRAAAEEADRAVAAAERGLGEARARIEVLEHDNESLRRSADERTQQIGALTGRQGELDRQLADAQRRSADLEAKLAAEQAARQAVEAQREAERAEAETQASAAAAKIDALTARIAAADKILDQTRDQLREKSEALLASERNLKEAAIETQRLERKLETVQRDLGQRLAEAEDFATTRADLIERAEALARTVAAKELALESAEDKAAKLAERIEALTARHKAERGELEAANRALMEELRSERSERALAQGALEISRENRAKIQKQLAVLRHRLRAGREGGDEALLIDYGADEIESETATTKALPDRTIS